MALDIGGHAAPGWELVADAFAKNFVDGNDLGAAVTVYCDAEKVVDLWGGVADARTGAPWQQDTVVPVFSSTKGATAIGAHMLVESGQLDLEAPVAQYWPEFAQAGKAEVPVRWLLAHRAGLPFVDADISFEDLRAEAPVLRALEAQTPLWESGTSFAYHAVTFGHLVGEVIHRVTGQKLAQYFDEAIAAPLGLQAWMALPIDEQVDLARLERVTHPVPPSVAELMGPESTFGRSITLGHALPFELVNDEPRDFNDREMLAITLGGSSMVSDARSLSRMYAACVGEVDGVRLLSDESVRRAAEVQTRDLPYYAWPEKLAAVRIFDFALGFSPSPGDHVQIGHGGAGGSVGFADLDSRVGFGYVMNRMDAAAPDTRSASLMEAVHTCVSTRGSR
jgi:CubicO group peptidase (beta-lactamase class C family)